MCLVNDFSVVTMLLSKQFYTVGDLFISLNGATFVSTMNLWVLSVKNLTNLLCHC